MVSGSSVPRKSSLNFVSNGGKARRPSSTPKRPSARRPCRSSATKPRRVTRRPSSPASGVISIATVGPPRRNSASKWRAASRAQWPPIPICPCPRCAGSSSASRRRFVDSVSTLRLSRDVTATSSRPPSILRARRFSTRATSPIRQATSWAPPTTRSFPSSKRPCVRSRRRSSC